MFSCRLFQNPHASSTGWHTGTSSSTLRFTTKLARSLLRNWLTWKTIQSGGWYRRTKTQKKSRCLHGTNSMKTFRLKLSIPQSPSLRSRARHKQLTLHGSLISHGSSQPDSAPSAPVLKSRSKEVESTGPGPAAACRPKFSQEQSQTQYSRTKLTGAAESASLLTGNSVREPRRKRRYVLISARGQAQRACSE